MGYNDRRLNLLSSLALKRKQAGSIKIQGESGCDAASEFHNFCVIDISDRDWRCLFSEADRPKSIPRSVIFPSSIVGRKTFRRSVIIPAMTPGIGIKIGCDCNSGFYLADNG